MRIKEEYKAIGISVIAGVAIWFSDVFIDSVFFHESSFMELAFHDVSSFEIYFRTTIFLIAVTSGVLIAGYLKRMRIAEENLKEAYAELKQIFDSGVPSCVIDKNRDVIKANESFFKYFGYVEEDLTGMKCNEIIPCTECSTINCRVDRISRDAKEIVDEETEIRMRDGRNVSSIVRATPYFNAENELLGIVESFIDITQRKEAEDMAADLMDKLVLKNEELENFAMTIAHDLKTPLTMVSNAVSLIEKTRVETSEKDATYIGWIKSGVTKMNNMISGLLDYCFIGQEKIDHQQFTLGDIADEVKSAHKQKLVERGVTTAVQNSGVSLYADRLRMVQVLDNLVSNSLKYMGKLNSNPFIEIGAEVKGGENVIYVKDNGVGIKKENFAKVFGVFHRIKDLEDVEGSGVGLSIVKRIVENHGGRVWVESEYGKGSTFYFTIKNETSTD